MYRAILSVCIEKLHRTPAECGHIPLTTIYDILALEELNQEEYEKNKPQ